MSYYKVHLMSNLIRDYNKLPKKLWQYKATNANNIWKSNVLKKPCHFPKLLLLVPQYTFLPKFEWKSQKKHPIKGNCSHKLVMLGWWKECGKMDGLHNPQGRASQIGGHINHVKTT